MNNLLREIWTQFQQGLNEERACLREARLGFLKTSRNHAAAPPPTGSCAAKQHRTQSFSRNAARRVFSKLVSERSARAWFIMFLFELFVVILNFAQNFAGVAQKLRRARFQKTRLDQKLRRACFPETLQGVPLKNFSGLAQKLPGHVSLNNTPSCLWGGKETMLNKCCTFLVQTCSNSALSCL